MPVTKTPILKILSDLGIDLMDVDNDEDYLRALMEGVNQLTIIDPKHRDIPTLQKEIRRVRQSRKAAAPSPGMQATKKKISGASIKRGGALAIADKTSQIVTQPVVQQTTVVAGKGGEKSSSPQFLQGLIKILKGILDNVNGMLSVLAGQQLFEKRRDRRERKKAEKAARTTREGKLEEENDRFAGLKKMGEKIISPVIGLWGRLWDFLSTIFLGRLAMKLWDWLSDPENQKKLQRIAQSIAEWWPGFLQGTKDFFAEVGNFAKWVVDNIGAWTTTLLTTTIPALTAALVGMGPWGVAGAATAGLAGGLIWNQTQKSGDEEESSTTTPEQTVETTTQDSLPQSDKIDPVDVYNKNIDLIPGWARGRVLEEINKDPSAYDTREEIEDALSRLGIDAGRIKYAEGGQVPGRGDKDTVPAMLTPGEFVMSKGAVEKYGADVLASMNAMGGGTNIPLIPGLGGGGGGTDALTEQAKVKKFASAILDFFMGNDSEQFLNGGGLVGPYGPVLDLIGKYESGNQWDRMYPSTNLPGATQMTISEVARKASGAVGRWQNMPRFLEGRAKAVGLDPNTALYNEDNQTKIAVYLIERGQAGVTPAMLKNNPDEAMLRLSRVWAAVPVPYTTRGGSRTVHKGESYYAGVGSNKAHITPQQMYDAMGGKGKFGRGSSGSRIVSGGSSSKEGTRSAYESLIDSGHTPNTAQITADLMSGFTFSDLISKVHKPKPPVVNPPSTPKSTVVYEREMAQQAEIGMPGSKMSLPTLDPAAMISAPKIQTLGIAI